MFLRVVKMKLKKIIASEGHDKKEGKSQKTERVRERKSRQKDTKTSSNIHKVGDTQQKD